MEMIFSIYKKYLQAYISGDYKEIKEYIDDRTTVSDFLSKRQGKSAMIRLPFLPDSFNFYNAVSSRPIVILDKGKVHIYSTVSFLAGIERGNEIETLISKARMMPIGTEIKENHEIYWVAFGGKVEFVFDEKRSYISSFTYDQEFVGGNTFLFSGFWSSFDEHERLIDSSGLYKNPKDDEDAILRFFWGLDVADSELASSFLDDNSDIKMEKPYGGKLEFSSVAEFIRDVKAQYDMNYHLFMIRQTEENTYSLFRLRQDRLGNKFRGHKDLYTLYFNEIFTIKTKDRKIISMDSRRVEIPETAGYDALII